MARERLQNKAGLRLSCVESSGRILHSIHLVFVFRLGSLSVVLLAHPLCCWVRWRAPMLLHLCCGESVQTRPVAKLRRCMQAAGDRRFVFAHIHYQRECYGHRNNTDVPKGNQSQAQLNRRQRRQGPVLNVLVHGASKSLCLSESPLNNILLHSKRTFIRLVPSDLTTIFTQRCTLTRQSKTCCGSCRGDTSYLHPLMHWTCTSYIRPTRLYPYSPDKH